ncbi:hypothetical protein FQZ97_992690 [compost metagenome]
MQRAGHGVFAFEFTHVADVHHLQCGIARFEALAHLVDGVGGDLRRGFVHERAKSFGDGHGWSPGFWCVGHYPCPARGPYARFHERAWAGLLRGGVQ